MNEPALHPTPADDSPHALKRGPVAYKAISSYGIIGDMRSAALIGIDGSIDWCCFPRFDSGSVFAAILDDRLGGRMQIVPVQPYTAAHRYLPLTNILVTSFHTRRQTGVVEITDFMPVPPLENVIAEPHEIHRRIRGLRGDVELDIIFEPRFDYGRAETAVVRQEHGVHATSGSEDIILAAPPGTPWKIDAASGRAVARVAVKAGDSLWIVLRYDATSVEHVASYQSAAKLENTADFWDRWARGTTYEGPYRAEVERSALALKLMFYTPTGAVVAAPTTSLPEEIGGVRNWDYRYSWIRDASFTLSAFHLLGHHDEANAYMRYLLWIARKADHLQIMYGIGGESELQESELAHLEGYRGSGPVRIGNGAYNQRQLDVYGELIGSAYLWHDNGDVSDEVWELLKSIIDLVATSWREADHGIWEIRREPRHYVHSKLMCWVALDRGVKFADRRTDSELAARWAGQRDAVYADIMERGWSEEKQAFVQHYGTSALDAANLLMPVVGFLPGDHPRVRATIKATLNELMRDGMLFRYLNEDGLPGDEGIFGICSFWLADALILSGDLAHGERVFRRMLRWANPLDLYSEEIDPRTGDFLGNFPQAFTHIALINTAHLLEMARQTGGRAQEDFLVEPSGNKP